MCEYTDRRYRESKDYKRGYDACCLDEPEDKSQSADWLEGYWDADEDLNQGN